MVASTAFSAHRALMHILRLMAAHALSALPDKRKIRMAAFTGHGRMPAQQRERRQIVIKTDLMLPAGFVMAAFTGRIQRALVHIILAMALGALRRWDGFMNIVLMALFASHFGMRTAQDKIGFVMIETTIAPALNVVALGTFLAVLAKMHVIMLMTTVAGTRQVCGDGTALMAGRTAERLMRAFEFEVGVALVIEIGL